jgi:hypothetical protein
MLTPAIETSAMPVMIRPAITGSFRPGNILLRQAHRPQDRSATVSNAHAFRFRIPSSPVVCAIFTTAIRPLKIIKMD